MSAHSNLADVAARELLRAELDDLRTPSDEAIRDALLAVIELGRRGGMPTTADVAAAKARYADRLATAKAAATAPERQPPGGGDPGEP